VRGYAAPAKLGAQFALVFQADHVRLNVPLAKRLRQVHHHTLASAGA
jgi:hypothetical protein